MSVIGDAFVAIHPDSAGFASKLEGQLRAVNLGGVGALVGATAVAGVVVGLAKIGQEFGSARVQIQRETGATGAELTRTFDTVKTVLKDVPDSITKVTDAVDELRRRGTPLGASLDKLATQELDLARITKTDLAGNVEATTALFAKFNVPLQQQPAALDAIFKGYQQSGKGLSELTGSLLSGGAALGQFGFDIFQSTALVAGLTKAGVNVQPALAGLRKAFGQIAKEGGDPKKALQDLIDEFTNGTPPAKALSDAIKLFGTRSGAELATAIQQGKFEVKDLLKLITDGKGGIEDTSLATRTFGEELGILKNQVLVDLQPLGTAVWTALRGAILSATKPVGDLVSNVARLAKALAPLGVIVAILAGSGFKLLLGVVSLVAKGLSATSSAAEHMGPVLVTITALLIGLALAFRATLPAAGELTTASELAAVFASSTRDVAAAVAEASTAQAVQTRGLVDNTTAYGNAAGVVAANAEAHATVAKAVQDEAVSTGALVDAQAALFTSSEALAQSEGQLAILFPEMVAGMSVYEAHLAELVAAQQVAGAQAGILAGQEAAATARIAELSALAAGESVAGGFLGGLTATLAGFANPLTIAIAGFALLGLAVKLFAGHESAASKEAKELTKSLVDTSNTAGIFSTNIGSADQAFADFLTKQDADGKLKDLDKVLTGTGVSLKGVSTAVTGTADDFNALKETLGGTAGFTREQTKALAEVDAGSGALSGALGTLTEAQAKQVFAAHHVNVALDQQRDAFIQSAQASLDLITRSGQITPAQARMADQMAHATTGVRGYGAALDFANEAATENVKKTEAAKIASAQFAPQLAELRTQILKGNISTNDAATAASKWGLSLDATKQIISDTQAALKSFVDEGLAGLPSSTDAVNTWSQDVQSAFTNFAQANAKSPAIGAAGDAQVAAASARLTHAQTAAATAQASAQATAQRQLDVALARQQDAVGKSAGTQAAAAAAVEKAHAAIAAAATKGSGAVVSAQAAVDAAYAKSGKAAGQNAADTLKAQQALNVALDPENVVKKVRAQAQQIVDFQTNILKLVHDFPAAARALLSDPDKTAAAAFASQLVNKPAIAKEFDQAQTILQNKTRDLKDLLKGPLADQFLNGGQVAGTSLTAGVAKTTKIAPVVNAQTQAALTSLAQQEKFARAAGDLGAAATFAMQQKMILQNVAQSQVADAATAVTTGGAKVTKAAGDLGKLATGTYANGLNVKAKTETAIAQSADAWDGAITATTASSARAGGRVVGFQFGKGIIDGLRLITPQVQTAAVVVAAAVIDTTKHAMRQSSPSKVGIEIGANFGSSIGIGIVQSSRDAVSSTSTLVGNIVDAISVLKSRAQTVTAGIRLGDVRGALQELQQQVDKAKSTVQFTLPPVRIRTDLALADLRVVEAVLAKLRADVAAASKDPIAAKNVPQDLRNLQAAYAVFNRTQVKPLSAVAQVKADTAAAQRALFTFAADFNRFKNDASKAPLLAAELRQVKATSDALAQAKANLLKPPTIPPIKVDIKYGRIPLLPPLELGVFLPRTLPRPVVHVDSDTTALERAAKELRDRFAHEPIIEPFGVARDSLVRARDQISELADNLDAIRTHVPQLPDEQVKITADTTALIDAMREAGSLVTKPVVVPFHGDTTKLVADVQGALGKVTANQAVVAVPTPTPALVVPTTTLVAPRPVEHDTQTIVKEANIKVEFHKVDPPDPHDFAREIGWSLP